MQAYRESKAAEIQNYKVDASAAAAVPAHRIVIPVNEGTVDIGVDGSVPFAGLTMDYDTEVERPVDVQNTGIGIVETGAAVALNDPLTADAAGKAVPAASGDYIIGYAKQIAGATDILISVQLELGVMP